MTVTELLAELKAINQERTLATLHDDAFFQDFPDIDALNSAIILIEFLSEKKPSDKLTVAEIFKAAEVDF